MKNGTKRMSMSGGRNGQVPEKKEKRLSYLQRIALAILKTGVQRGGERGPFLDICKKWKVVKLLFFVSCFLFLEFGGNKRGRQKKKKKEKLQKWVIQDGEEDEQKSGVRRPGAETGRFGKAGSLLWQWSLWSEKQGYFELTGRRNGYQEKGVERSQLQMLRYPIAKGHQELSKISRRGYSGRERMKKGIGGRRNRRNFVKGE